MATGEEARYLDDLRDSRQAVVVRLIDRDDVRGRIVDHDREVIELETPGGPQRLLRKSEIRSLVEDDGAH